MIFTSVRVYARAVFLREIKTIGGLLKYIIYHLEIVQLFVMISLICRSSTEIDITFTSGCKNRSRHLKVVRVTRDLGLQLTTGPSDSL